MVFERNRLSGPPFEQSARGTGERIELPAGLVFRSIGYKGTAMPGVPFDPRQGVFPTRAARIVDAPGTVVPGLYACGWIKRGPTGIIGTNKPCSVATVPRSSPTSRPTPRPSLGPRLFPRWPAPTAAGW